MALRQLEHESDFLYDFTCSPCAADDKNAEAIKFCIDCGEYLCDNCLNDHNRFAKMKSHQTVDPSKQQDPTTISVPTITICCEKHEGKILDMYCGEHGEVCCAVCIALDHSLCTSKDYIPNISKDFQQTVEFKQIESEGQTIMSDLESIVQKKHTDIALYKTQKDAIFAHFKQVKKDILEQFKEIEKRSIDYVEDKFQQIVANADEDIKKTEMVYKTLKGNEDNLKTEMDESQLFVLAKKTGVFRAFAKETVENMLATKDQPFDFRINEDVRKCLKSFKSLGYFYTTKRHARCEVFNVQDQDERVRCDITCFCQLPDGDLVVVDAANQSVKRLGSTYSITDKRKLSSQPWSVCNISDKEIAVSLCNEKKIQFLFIKGKMKLSSSFNVKDSCTGLASISELLYVGLYKRKQIQVYDYSGYPKSVIDLTNGVPWHIAASIDLASLYVACRADRVFSVDLMTRKPVKVDVPGVNVASSLAVTANDSLLVSCQQDNKIVQYTNIDCTTLLTKLDSFKAPQAIFYDQKERLIVASEKTNVIGIYSEGDEILI